MRFFPKYQPVNPHKYLRETMADLTASDTKAGL
jgi:hypothetical protein